MSNEPVIESEKQYMAYAPNGLRITHEYWQRPYSSPITFHSVAPGEPLSRYDFVTHGVRYEGDYDASKEHDIEHLQGEWLPWLNRHAELRWQDEQGNLWDANDLTFEEKK